MTRPTVKEAINYCERLLTFPVMREDFSNFKDEDKTENAIKVLITAAQDSEKLREATRKAYIKMEEARILSVKEPMQLSDRITLNGLIREAQSALNPTTQEDR